MRETTRINYSRQILKVLLHIQDHLDETMSLDELSAVAGFSPYHFHRIFRGMVGETLAEHIRRLRLERAAVRLLRTPQSVTDIAFDAGYDSVEAFIRAFKSMFHRTPSRYRQTGHKGISGTERPGRPRPKTPGGESVMNHVEIVRQPARTIAFVRHIGPYEDCGPAWETLCRWAGPRRLLTRDTRYLGLSYDDPELTPADKIRYDACITVPKGTPPAGEVGIQEIPEGDFAVYIHKGPFSGLSQSYAALCGEWLPHAGREIKDSPSVEIYLNNPDTTPPEDLRVEIQLPLKD